MGPFFIVIPELSHGSLWLAVWLVVLLPCHWEFTSSREIQTLGNAFDVQVTPSTLIEEQYGTPLLNHYAMHTLDGRIETSQFPGIHPIDECYAVTWKISLYIFCQVWMSFPSRWLTNEWRFGSVVGRGYGRFSLLFLKPFILVESDETFIFLLSFFKRRRRQ